MSAVPGSDVSRASAVLAAANGAFRMVAAAAEDALAAADRLDVTGANGSPSDPFAARDADYVRQTLPALRVLSEVYFRADVSGLDRIPAQGAVLLVGNHSGGTMIADTFVFAQAFYDHFGPDRRFHQLAHDLVFKVPGLRTLVQQYGTVPASPENMRRALDKDAALLVYPGGDEESFRPSWESSTVAFAGRTGFVKLALESGVPIVPVVALGGQETGLFLGRGRRIASALSLNRLARLKVLPPVLGPPFGITVLDLPVRIPLPSKITIRVMPQIDLRGEARRGRRHRGGLPPRHEQDAAHFDPPSRPAQSPGHRTTGASGMRLADDGQSLRKLRNGLHGGGGPCPRAGAMSPRHG